MYAFDFGKGLVSSFERTSDDGIVVSNRDETGFVDADPLLSLCRAIFFVADNIIY